MTSTVVLSMGQGKQCDWIAKKTTFYELKTVYTCDCILVVRCKELFD